MEVRVNLTGKQREKLQLALLSAFPRRGNLEQFVSFSFNERLDELVEGGNYRKVVFDLIEWARSEGRLEELITGAYTANPGNPDLRVFVAEIRQQVFLPDTRVVMPQEVGPEIEWRGPSDEEIQLQNWLRPPPNLLDVGFLMRAIQRASSVCRIDIPVIDSQGTGFLIAPTLLLTNYHVLKPAGSNIDIEASARDAVLHFGYFTAANGSENSGNKFKLLSEQPLLKQSPIRELDYVLLRVEDKITQFKEMIKPAPWDHQTRPSRGMGMNILQHPEGEAMKLAITSDGITGVYQESGLVQYVTIAKGGSSGSPCFNDEWKVIALHHAERARAFGSIREGILFSAIYTEIKEYL
jgi:endonuclease G, mitochondrial